MVRYRLVETAWGLFGLVARDDGLVATFLPQARGALLKRLRSQWPEAREAKTLMPRFCHQVGRYFEGRAVSFAVDVDLSDLPPFRQRVLEACGWIPYGQTATYAELAAAAGRPGAARAVGGAMASNPLPLVIPCHRVVRTDGSLGGFSSPRGVSEKKRLLSLEASGVLRQATAGRSGRTRAA